MQTLFHSALIGLIASKNDAARTQIFFGRAMTGGRFSDRHEILFPTFFDLLRMPETSRAA